MTLEFIFAVVSFFAQGHFFRYHQLVLCPFSGLPPDFRANIPIISHPSTNNSLALSYCCRWPCSCCRCCCCCCCLWLLLLPFFFFSLVLVVEILLRCKLVLVRNTQEANFAPGECMPFATEDEQLRRGGFQNLCFLPNFMTFT